EQNEPEVTCEHKVEKLVQACITQKFRSKAVQINIKTKDQASSPLKPSIISSSTSPFKAEIIKKTYPSVSNLNKVTRTVLNKEEHSDSDISLYTPSVHQIQTSKAINSSEWSDKKTNTIKYLISCTPNGLVNYISPGFGGRTTDTCVVESCDFVKSLKSGMVVMADRGFKHVEQYLKKSNITLVRPPSVETGVKMSKKSSKANQTDSQLENTCRKSHSALT
ncbi:hypothetical protein SFRURICE_016284, partial [Spodoptera frugiperda]